MVEQVCGWREVSCPNDILSPEALNKLADACTISLKASDRARHASLSETFRIGPIFDAGWFENAVPTPVCLELSVRLRACSSRESILRCGRLNRT